MMPYGAVLPLVVVVGIPLTVLPSWPLAAVAMALAALSVGGIGARSVPVVTAGAALAIIEYAVALSVAGGPPDVLTAAVFGTALLLLIESADFAARTRGAVLSGGVTAAVVRHWLVIAAAGIALIVAIVAAVGAVAIGIRLPSHTVAVAAGAVGAFIAAVGILKLVTTSDG